MIVLRNVELLGGSRRRHILIDQSQILEIVAKAPNGHPEIVFDDALAFPGLINSHDHLDFDCYPQLDGGPYRDYVEWGEAIHHRHAATIATVEAIPRTLRVRTGIAKNLACGVTSVAHHGSDPQCNAASVDVIGGTRSIHSPRLGRLSEMLIPDRRPVVAHVGEGIDSGAQREIDTFIRWNVWRKTLIAVHAIAMTTEQAKRFGAVAWCPVSNEFLFGRTAPVAQLKAHVPFLFGTDSTLTASWNIWEHLRRAREHGGLTDDELIAAVTTTAARIWKLANRGVIAPGAAADIVVARRRLDDQREAFFAINPEDILLVMKDGRIVLVDASLRNQLSDDVTLFPCLVQGADKLTAESHPFEGWW